MVSVYRVPISDISAGGWSPRDNINAPDTDIPLDCWQMLDETLPFNDNNGTIIINRSDGVGQAPCRVRLKNPGTPPPGSQARINVTGTCPDTGFTAFVGLRLFELAVPRTAKKLHGLSNFGPGIGQFPLTATEISNITNWSNLELEISLEPTGGILLTRRVSIAELETF